MTLQPSKFTMFMMIRSDPYGRKALQIIKDHIYMLIIIYNVA